MQLPFYHSPYFLLCMANLFWSLNFIIGKLVGTVIPPATISFFRWALPMALYAYFCRRAIKEDLAVYKQHWLLVTILGGTGYCLNSVTVYYAVLHTSVINTSFINAFNPVVIALAGFVCFRTPLSARQVFGFLLAFIGVIWIVFQGDPAAIMDVRVNSGDVVMLINVVIWTIHTIMYKRYAKILPAQSLFAMMMVAGVVVTVPMMFIENWQVGLDWVAQVSCEHILGLLALCVFPSVLAYRFWNEALSQVSTDKAAISQYTIPVYTVIISVLFFNEGLQGFQLVGGLLIFAGVLLAMLHKSN